MATLGLLSSIMFNQNVCESLFSHEPTLKQSSDKEEKNEEYVERTRY